jgi:gamma-glutamylcysteine synthetase
MELLEAVGAAAELLDADAEGYVAAVDSAKEAVRDPARTPSAALLAALASERASFFEYSHELARSHAAYFRDFALSAERERALEATARRSLEEAEDLGARTRAVRGLFRDYFAQA